MGEPCSSPGMWGHIKAVGSFLNPKSKVSLPKEIWSKSAIESKRGASLITTRKR